MNGTTREPVILSTHHLTPFSTVIITTESRYWRERPRSGADDRTDDPRRMDDLTAADLRAAGDWDASYNSGLKDTPTAVYRRPQRPCLREIRIAMVQATTPAGVETGDSPQHLP